MNKKKIVAFIGILCVFVVALSITHMLKNSSKEKTRTMNATVLSVQEKTITLQDDNNAIYTFHAKNIDAEVGKEIIIKYTGLLDKDLKVQTGSIVDYKLIPTSNDENETDHKLLDDGMFQTYYTMANNKLKTMTLDEKIAQILLVRYPETNAKEILKQKQFGGYIFFAKDFKDKTKEQVQNMMKQLQEVSKIPILTAVDEEGGAVVRVSSNPNLRSTRFKSSQQLYQEGGFSEIERDTIEKSMLLNDLGINLNLAPVVDVSTDPNDYMYTRSLGENTSLTSTFAKTVIKASKGMKVSYTLKHFPGYGNNQDTHQGSSTDNRTLEEIKTNDLPPFQAGIEAGAEAVLVSHNIVTSIDNNNPASLSANVHNLLRDDLKFTGVIITDDLDMGAVSSIDNATVKAIQAGNDLIITTDYEASIHSIKNALDRGGLSENQIDKLAFRILAWKYYKGLITENTK